MELTQVGYNTTGRTAIVSLNRPRYKNAQSLRMLEELDAAFARASDDPAIRVIVLRGEGDLFSAGHDLGSPEHLADRDARPYGAPELGRHGRMRISWYEHELFARWRELPKPTIAAVHGFAIFNGWILASAMDIVFAAEDARFLAPSGAALWDLGVRRAKELRFRNRFLTAYEVLELGLVNRVEPADRLEAEVLAFAAEVAEQDPHSLWIAKLAANQMDDARGKSTFLRAEFGLYWADSGRSPAGPERRVGGRIRSGDVQKAFERGGDARALPKPSP